jgi:hypothetical protein
MSEIISLFGIFGLGAATNQLVQFYLNKRNTAREEKRIRYRTFTLFMMSYLYSDFDGANYNSGSQKITKEEARDSLIGWYTNCFMNEKISLIRLFSDFIKDPDETKLYLILNEIRQELGSKKFNKEIFQELIIKY